MKPVNTYYLFHLGKELAALDGIDLGKSALSSLAGFGMNLQGKAASGNPFEAYDRILNAARALFTFYESSIDIGISKTLARKLVVRMLKTVDSLQQEREGDIGITKEELREIREIKDDVKKFTSFLEEELAKSDIYFVNAKAGFQTATLIAKGELLFPAELSKKAPASVFDLRQGARCLAFELWTASAFHFHRANEAVVHAYWDHASSGSPRLKRNTVGDYLDAMDKKGIGTPQIKASLRDLNSLHRNPLIHPEHNIEDMDEAIALMNAVHNSIYSMLKEIPDPS